MKISDLSSDRLVQTELGNRVARQRLNRDISQDDLAEEAGISKRTLVRLEGGKPVNTTSLIRTLRALGLLARLDSLLPPDAISPIQRAKLEGRERRRASPDTASAEHHGETKWTWAAKA